MQKILLILFFFLLNGCSLNNLFLQEEVDKVMVVKYTPYMKHHRAYFSRTSLQKIKGKKYLYLYNRKTNDLAVLLHMYNKYMLHNMSNPEERPFVMYTKPTTTFADVLRGFKQQGFRPIHSLSSIGYTASVSNKRYKGIKTLLIETQEYTRLLSLYKHAIKTYSARKVKNIKTRLPKHLIAAYYNTYKKQAKTNAQKTQLNIIARKLHLPPFKMIKKIKPTSLLKEKKKTNTIEKVDIKNEIEKTPIEEETMDEPEEIVDDPIVIKPTPVEKKEIKILPIPKVRPEKPYTYYLHNASLNELSTYISNKATKNSLSYNQYNMLSKRKILLKEERLLKYGTLEELIAAYKINKYPKYKERIMSLMKDKQKQN